MSNDKRGHVTFDESCPDEFRQLVRETLETSDYIDTIALDGGNQPDPTDTGGGPLVLYEVADE